MSWCITINDLPSFDLSMVDPEWVEASLSQHICYFDDFSRALGVAKATGLRSVTLAGGRTPNPVTGDEIITISILGMKEGTDFTGEMKRIIGSGPDALALEHQKEGKRVE